MSVHDLWTAQSVLFLKHMLDGDLDDNEWRHWTFLTLEGARRMAKKEPHICRCAECESYQWQPTDTEGWTPYGRQS